MNSDPLTVAAPDAAVSDAEVLLSVRGVGVRFGGVQAVKDVSFDIRRGEILTLIGPNGAGKTTLFNLISRLYEPSSGTMAWLGKSLNELPAHRIADLGIARTFQNIELFEHASVLQNMLIGRHARRSTRCWEHFLFNGATRKEELTSRRKVEEIMELLDLQPYRDALVQGLPYGVRKVVELGRALAIEPRLLLLDEPSSGLNVEETEDMAFWIEDIRRDFGMTILMVEHDMGLVSRVSDRVVAMNQGEVLTIGRPEEVQSHPGVIEAYLGGGMHATHGVAGGVEAQP